MTFRGSPVGGQSEDVVVYNSFASDEKTKVAAYTSRTNPLSACNSALKRWLQVAIKVQGGERRLLEEKDVLFLSPLRSQPLIILFMAAPVLGRGIKPRSLLLPSFTHLFQPLLTRIAMVRITTLSASIAGEFKLK